MQLAAEHLIVVGKPSGPARCAATWRNGFNAGELCEEPVVDSAADVWLCVHHWRRLETWALRHSQRLARESYERDERAKTEARNARGGHEPLVYFVERDGFVKIGTTTNLAQRIKSLSGQSDSTVIPGISRGPVTLLATMPGDRERERQLHIQFDGCCVGGEWFLPNTRMLLLIERLKRRAEAESVAAA